MKGTMKKVGILIFVFSIGQIKALEPGVALASLEVNLNQLFEPNIKLFYDSSLQALDEAYTAAFRLLVDRGALKAEVYKSDNIDDYQVDPKDFAFGLEVATEDEKKISENKWQALEDNLEKAENNYQTMFGISTQKTGSPEQMDELFNISNLLKSPLMRVRSEIKVKPEPEPELPVWGPINDAATAKATLNTIKAGMANVDQTAADGYLAQFKRDKNAIANTVDPGVYDLAKEVAGLLKNISSADKANEWDEIIKVF